MSTHRIAVIPGDGIGKEVMPEGLRVMDAAARKFGIDLHFDHFDFSSWDYCEKHGKMLPDNWKDQIGGHDALYFGAVGWPEKIADHVSLWGSLLLFRREFDQYINLRPAHASLARLTCTSCVKTPKANTPVWVDACFRVRSAKS